MERQISQSHTWDIKTLHEARIERRKKIPYNKVKDLLDQVKTLMRKEVDPDIRRSLVNAGINLNNILLK